MKYDGGICVKADNELRLYLKSKHRAIKLKRGLCYMLEDENVGKEEKKGENL